MAKKPTLKIPAPPKGHEHFHPHSLSLELFFIWSTLMAKLSDVQASLDTQTAAIQALAATIAAKPPAAATEADLDGVKAGIDSNTAAVQAIVP